MHYSESERVSPVSQSIDWSCLVFGVGVGAWLWLVCFGAVVTGFYDLSVCSSYQQMTYLA